MVTMGLLAAPGQTNIKPHLLGSRLKALNARQVTSEGPKVTIPERGPTFRGRLPARKYFDGNPFDPAFDPRKMGQ